MRAWRVAVCAHGVLADIHHAHMLADIHHAHMLADIRLCALADVSLSRRTLTHR